MPDDSIQIVEEGDATGGVIPYKNPSALIAYYLAVFSLIPIIGGILGLAAVVLGVLGLRYRNRHPSARGAAHAWVGIVLGGLTTLLYGGMVFMFLIAVMTRR